MTIGTGLPARSNSRFSSRSEFSGRSAARASPDSCHSRFATLAASSFLISSAILACLRSCVDRLDFGSAGSTSDRSPSLSTSSSSSKRSRCTLAIVFSTSSSISSSGCACFSGKLWGLGRPRFLPLLFLLAFCAGGAKKSLYMTLLAFIPVSRPSRSPSSTSSSSPLSPSGAFRSALPKVGPPSSDSSSDASPPTPLALTLDAPSSMGSASQFTSSSSLSAPSPL